MGEKGGEDAAGVDGGFGEGGRALVPVLGGRLGQDWTERGKGRGEIFFQERGELFWRFGKSSRAPGKFGCFLWRDATGVELARVGAARGGRGDERTLLADVGERALAHARVAEALGPAFIRGRARWSRSATWKVQQFVG